MLVSGNDFYASPRLSRDGQYLAWLTWNHPNMPWDGCELWTARLTPEGAVQDARRVAGGLQESIFQPEWGPDGRLYFVSDRSGWWNLYRLAIGGPEGAPGAPGDGQGAQGPPGEPEALAPRAAEFGQPQWVFGAATYGFLSPPAPGHPDAAGPHPHAGARLRLRRGGHLAPRAPRPLHLPPGGGPPPLHGHP